MVTENDLGFFNCLPEALREALERRLSDDYPQVKTLKGVGHRDLRTLEDEATISKSCVIHPCESRESVYLYDNDGKW